LFLPKKKSVNPKNFDCQIPKENNQMQQMPKSQKKMQQMQVCDQNQKGHQNQTSHHESHQKELRLFQNQKKKSLSKKSHSKMWLHQGPSQPMESQEN
jgi:hypothetical protein